MKFDLKALAGNLLDIAEKAAPLVGLSNELAAGKALVEAITDTVEMVKGDMASDDQAALQTSLSALHAKVNAHADRTAESLG
jgi:hypothetical protein